MNLAAEEEQSQFEDGLLKSLFTTASESTKKGTQPHFDLNARKRDFQIEGRGFFPESFEGGSNPQVSRPITQNLNPNPHHDVKKKEQTPRFDLNARDHQEPNLEKKPYYPERNTLFHNVAPPSAPEAELLENMHEGYSV